MKNNLVLIGGSFGRAYQFKRNLSSISKRWGNILTDKLNLEEKNYCIAGCSIEYCMHELFKYIKSDEYNKKDIIIFLLTGIGCSPVIEPSFNPSWANNMSRFLNEKELRNKEGYNHYKKFNSFYTYLVTWAFENELIESKIFYILNTLKSLPNLTIVIPTLDNKIIFKYEDNHNSLIIKDKLMTISFNEYSNKNFLDTDHFGLFKDHRANHLSEINHSVLADELYKVIIKKSSKEFQINNFEKNIL